ncbi:porin [Joostella sp. CR20]|uniref:porin n=1 Tax=Joostella sp. CR20 TaxID=2804312 RepID=UPI00313D9F54
MTKFSRILVVATAMLLGLYSQAQVNFNRDLDNYRQPDKRGINVFEAPKDTATTFDGVKVRVGGSFALQFQGLDNENANLAGYELKSLGNNFNLPTANLDLDVQLYDGIRMHLRTYLSSRHHNEPYVKGGYILMDKLDFIHKGFLDNLMKYTTIKIGHMETNYGDAHFRRSDNAQAIYNPFVGNLIMDAFTTEVGAEVYYRRNNWLAMAGFTNGKLNQSVEEDESGTSGGASFVAKLGYDKQINDDLRVRLTGSIYNTGDVPNSYLYSADRAGARYYDVMQAADATSDDFRASRYDPKFSNRITALMFNPFVKYRGWEFFGTVELSKGRADYETSNRHANQYAAELLYRFGKDENLYVGSRYNLVNSEDISGQDVSINRFQVAAGWFMTKNILVKAEYVNQHYNDFGVNSILNEGKFHGGVLEAVISF